MPRPRLLLPLVVILLGAAAPAHGATVVRSDSGSDAAAIQDTVATFRADLGTSSERREISWASVPAAQTDANPLPGDFYAARGVLLSTPGTGLHVSNSEFGYDPDFFVPFSAPSLFSPFGSTVTNVDFVVPGSNTGALSRGFGAIFTHVSTAGHSKIQLLGVDGDVILSQPARAGALSFVGVSFDTERISRVRITSGDHSPGSGSTANDTTALDNLVYGEPQPDPDRDGVLSKTDNCPDVSNRGQEDLDDDEAGDACDEDVDGDGVPNVRDGFPLDKDESADSDGDGIGDKADTDDDNDGVPDKVEGKNGTNQRNPDTDGDGLIDSQDNCPITPNQDQADANGDKQGDACEDLVAPQLSSLRLRPATFRRGTKAGTRVSFRLSEAAMVRLTVLKAVAGHRKGARCLRGAPGKRSHNRRCTLYRAVRGKLVRRATAGVNIVRFPGLIGGHRLRSGRHILLVTATDLAGFPAKDTARAKFRILP